MIGTSTSRPHFWIGPTLIPTNCQPGSRIGSEPAYRPAGAVGHQVVAGESTGRVAGDRWRRAVGSDLTNTFRDWNGIGRTLKHRYRTFVGRLLIRTLGVEPGLSRTSCVSRSSLYPDLPCFCCWHRQGRRFWVRHVAANRRETASALVPPSDIAHSDDGDRGAMSMPRRIGERCGAARRRGSLALAGGDHARAAPGCARARRVPPVPTGLRSHERADRPRIGRVIPRECYARIIADVQDASPAVPLCELDSASVSPWAASSRWAA